MKCHTCHNEWKMVYSRGTRLAWVKKIKILLLLKPGEILLENNSFKDVVLSAQICKDCKNIIVDYSDKDIQEG